MSKKINFLRAGALTMVLAMGTTCFMSGTLAKYVTSGEGSDSARVAKFGVTVTANGETFAKEYAKTDTSFTLDANTVVSANKIVAPGTSGNMASMTLTGTPEVAVRVSYEIPEGVTMFSGWEVEGAYYCPIVITVDETEIKGLDYSSEAEFQAAVAKAISDYSVDYAAGTDLSTVGTDSLAISWAWPFSTSDANDIKDTALGNTAAGIDKDGNAITANPATINLTVKTTVTQID